MSVVNLERAAATAAWVSAALRGSCGVEHVIDVVGGVVGDGPPPAFLPHDQPEPLSLAFAIARWRGSGVVGWRYLPVAPGDAAGLPGPSAFSTTALECGVGLLSSAGDRLGLVPEMHDDQVVWREHEVPIYRSHDVFGSASEAERELLERLNSSVDLLESLELGHWQPESGDVRHDWTDPSPMPPGTGHRAERLALRSRRVLQLVELAVADDGGSRTSAEMTARKSSLTELARAARHAHAAAWNTALLMAGDRR